MAKELAGRNSSTPVGSFKMNDKLSAQLIAHINVKLALIGSPPVPIAGDAEFAEIVSAMAGQSREKRPAARPLFVPGGSAHSDFSLRLSSGYCSGHQIAGTHVRPLTGPACPGFFPCRFDRSEFHSDIIQVPTVSSRVCCIIHAVTGERRRAFFHVTEGGLPIPDDKLGSAENHCSPNCSRLAAIHRGN